MKKCSYCAEEIQSEAVKCRYCGERQPDLREWDRFAQQFKEYSPRYKAATWKHLSEKQREYLMTQHGIERPEDAKSPLPRIFGIAALIVVGAGLYGIVSVDGEETLGVVYVFVLFFGLYCLPSILALSRNHHQAGAVVVINLFLGWTFIGWVVALAMSLSRVKGAAGTRTA